MDKDKDKISQDEIIKFQIKCMKNGWELEVNYTMERMFVKEGRKEVMFHIDLLDSYDVKRIVGKIKDIFASIDDDGVIKKSKLFSVLVLD